jgi:Flp pilus assembly pilin Flp
MRVYLLLVSLIARCTWSDERGLEAVEYALVGAMLVAILLAINPQFSNGIAGVYTTISNAISSAVN